MMFVMPRLAGGRNSEKNMANKQTDDFDVGELGSGAISLMWEGFGVSSLLKYCGTLHCRSLVMVNMSINVYLYCRDVSRGYQKFSPRLGLQDQLKKISEKFQQALGR